MIESVILFFNKVLDLKTNIQEQKRIMTNRFGEMPTDCFQKIFLPFLDSWQCLRNLSMVSSISHQECKKIVVFRTISSLHTDVKKIRSIFPNVKIFEGENLILNYDQDVLELLRDLDLPQRFTIHVPRADFFYMIGGEWKCPSVLDICAITGPEQNPVPYLIELPKWVDEDMLHSSKSSFGTIRDISGTIGDTYWLMKSKNDKCFDNLNFLKGMSRILNYACVDIFLDETYTKQQVLQPKNNTNDDDCKHQSVQYNETIIYSRESKRTTVPVLTLDSVPIKLLEIRTIFNGLNKEVHIQSPIQNITFSHIWVEKQRITDLPPYRFRRYKPKQIVVTVFIHCKQEQPIVVKVKETCNGKYPLLIFVTNFALELSNLNDCCKPNILVCTHDDFFQKRDSFLSRAIKV